MQPREFAEISLKDIDQVAKSSFPLCMRHLFDKIRDWSSTMMHILCFLLLMHL